MDEIDWTELQREAGDIWRHNAEFWDQRMGEGNDFQLTLVHPSVERLLQIEPGELILDAACGNGIFSRRLADLGAKVVAFDLEPMIRLAEARSERYRDSIEYRILDATDRDALAELDSSRFDAACCNMALMDIADINPLLAAMPRLLKPGGRFVFSVCHPCFNTSGVARVLEQSDVDGELINAYSLRVLRYLSLEAEKGIAMVGQPEPQYYFNRTLSQLFGECFRAGLIVDGLEEPAFKEPWSKPSTAMWDRLPEIPPVLTVRTRPRGEL
ncbi:MAG TPA: class I SAM-dependent methyltransferase [Chloroflexota bacterium]|nr:class I SAM-dependent methyltransferase [Chloroflexota bacterium]